jgi:DNA polymerase-1
LSELDKQSAVSFDTETTSLNPLEAELVGISFSWSANKAYYLHLADQEIETSVWLEKLKPFFENTAVVKIGQNLKYDIKVLRKYGISVKGGLFDTMLAHYLINPDMRHNMTVLSETYLNYSPIEITQLIGKKGKGQKSMREVPLAQLTEYAAEDADVTFQLYALFKEELKTANLDELFNALEVPLLNVLADMELEGINLDTSYLEGLNHELTTDIDNLEQAIYQQAGREFNIASPKQLGVVLFEDMKLVDKPKKTKTGQYATSEDILVELAKSHEIASNILEYRGLAKLKSTYVEALPQQLNLETKRIHTEYMQTVAATGRLSSNNPNLQNIPIRTERGKAVRKAFVPKDENYVLMAADYSQIELRIIAALAKEENMIKAFQNDFDIHADTASKVFNVPIEEVSRTQRSHAKTVNFGIIYGVSAFGLSNQTDLSRKEAKELIDTYYETYPKLRAYMQNQVNSARENGYVETVLGRRRYLKDINSRNAIVRGAAERNAVNAPIQGSAADIIKLAMIEIHKQLKAKNFKSKMLLQVHDELVFDAHKDELESLQNLIVSAMENAYTFEVPLKVDVGLGSDWLEAH